jgi:uncharacterized protein (TIGR01619 family)
MVENWKSYFSNVNYKFASLALNLGLRPETPMPDKPWLLWIWIYLLVPDDRGLTIASEAKVIWEIEKKLETALIAACGGIYCGRITTDGKRELYFYGKSEVEFEAAVKTTMSSFGEYRFDLGAQYEPDWNQYLNVLHPSDEDMQRIGNRDLIEVFEKKGDTLETEREVDHWIYFSREVDRELFAQMVLQRGYQIGTVPDQPEDDQPEDKQPEDKQPEDKQPEDKQPFGLIAIRRQNITLADINNTVIELFRLAKAANGLYDGWEAEVIAKDKASDPQ